MINEDGTPNTAHSLAKVPCFIIQPQVESLKLHDGTLVDIAPTILDMLGIQQPQDMSGQTLIDF